MKEKTLRWWLEREPTGQAFIEFVCWLRDIQQYETHKDGLIENRRKELIEFYGGNAEGVEDA